MTINRQKIVESQQLVIDVFKGFRSELINAYGSIDHTRKADMTQVTELDVKVEQVLKEKLTELFPEFGYQGEETGKSGNDQQFWLVDPIDGTSSFIRGIPVCTNMAALIVDNQPVAAVIYDFIRDIVYTAVKGEGAYKDAQKIHVAYDRKPGNLSIYSLSGHRFDDLRVVMFNAGMKCFYPVGAAGHAYVMLAEGKIDGVVAFNTKTSAHDNAPGMLLVTEAGGSIKSFDGRDDIYMHEFIAGSPVVIELARQHQDAVRTLIDL
ncbi:inositol monophosphatase [Candidatus Saccharibacteria bacterium]|nr:inositol monophosphatase [Candidatus Saccharibacteria bacterium]